MANSLDNSVSAFGSQLHDFPRQIDDPDDLFFFSEHFFADVKHSLINVGNKFLIFDDLAQLIELYVSNSVDNDGLLFGVPSHDAVHVYFLQILYLLIG